MIDCCISHGSFSKSVKSFNKKPCFCWLVVHCLACWPWCSVHACFAVLLQINTLHAVNSTPQTFTVTMKFRLGTGGWEGRQWRVWRLLPSCVKNSRVLTCVLITFYEIRFFFLKSALSPVHFYLQTQRDLPDEAKLSFYLLKANLLKGTLPISNGVTYYYLLLKMNESV